MKCIAVDLGASGGRVIVASLENGKISLEEAFRFKNRMTELDGTCTWDTEVLLENIKKGLQIAGERLAQAASDVRSVGLDTWGVDYVLLDEKDQPILPVYAYRDHRTDHTPEKLFEKISRESVYEKTGIQVMQFNTIFQLFQHAQDDPEVTKKAKTLLMLPDYLNYRLSGSKTAEFSIVSTSQLYNVKEKNWDQELIALTGFDPVCFQTIIKPGTVIGELTEELCTLTGLDKPKVISPACHDTGSAVASVPLDYSGDVDSSDDYVYISSGTWSLLGMENKEPRTDSLSRKYNYSNEGGVCDTFRYLKNIMGLWLIQEVQRIYNQYSFGELVELALETKPFKALINPNNQRFLNPKNMIKEIQSYCKDTAQEIPESPGEIARCIFESLAFQYNEVIGLLRELTGKKIPKIHIIGGGAQNGLLNQLTADFTGCKVYAGPVEATAIGNVSLQFIALGEIKDLKEARKIIRNSFEINEYLPKERNESEEQAYVTAKALFARLNKQNAF